MAKDNAAVTTGAEFHAHGLQQRIVPKGGQSDEGISREGEDGKKDAPLRKVRFAVEALCVSMLLPSREGDPASFLGRMMADIYKQHTISRLACPQYCCFSGNSRAF